MLRRQAIRRSCPNGPAPTPTAEVSPPRMRLQGISPKKGRLNPPRRGFAAFLFPCRRCSGLLYSTAMSEVPHVLTAIEEGGPQAAAHHLQLVCDELRQAGASSVNFSRTARGVLRPRGRSPTLSS
jgi:hypothetical protein